MFQHIILHIFANSVYAFPLLVPLYPCYCMHNIAKKLANKGVIVNLSQVGPPRLLRNKSYFLFCQHDIVLERK